MLKDLEFIITLFIDVARKQRKKQYAKHQNLQGFIGIEESWNERVREKDRENKTKRVNAIPIINTSLNQRMKNAHVNFTLDPCYHMVYPMRYEH